MKLSLLAVGFILFFALSEQPARPQPKQTPAQPKLIPRSPEERERHYQNLHRLFLNAQVSAPSGQPVSDLTASDFIILNDHRPEKITSFRIIHANSGGNHDRVILVLDAVNNSSGKVRHSRHEIEKYLNTENASLTHSTSIAFFSDSGMRIGVPTTNRVSLLHQLTELAGSTHGSTCADVTPAMECGMPSSRSDTFSRTCDPNARLVCLNHLFNSSITARTSLAQEQADSPGRVIVIWIGKGWPLLDQPGFVPDTTDVKAAFYRNLVTISSELAQAQITLDVVGSTAEMPIHPKHIRDSSYFRGASSEDEVSAESLSLQALSSQSGGLVLTSARDIAAQIKRCVADLDLYNSFAFDYQPASEFGTYHVLELNTDKPDTAIRTRTLYYAEH